MLRLGDHRCISESRWSGVKSGGHRPSNSGRISAQNHLTDHSKPRHFGHLEDKERFRRPTDGLIRGIRPWTIDSLLQMGVKPASEGTIAIQTLQMLKITEP